MSHPRPKRLHKYQPPTSVAFENLERQQVWLTPPAEFNDPYDCALHVFRDELSDAQFAQWREWLRANDPLDPAAEAFLLADGEFTAESKQTVLAAMSDAFATQRTELLSTVGIACLSESHDNLLMWGHYAHGHRGFCLAFESGRSPFDHADRVDYVTDIPVVDPLSILPGASPSSYIRTMLLTKAACWSYEAEWRVLSREPNSPASYAGGGLAAIYIGAAASALVRDRVRAIAQQLQVPVHEMAAARDRFTLTWTA